MSQIWCVCRPGDLCLACHRTPLCMLKALHQGECQPAGAKAAK